MAEFFFPLKNFSCLRCNEILPNETRLKLWMAFPKYQLVQAENRNYFCPFNKPR
jgi:hypothetical protein